MIDDDKIKDEQTIPLCEAVYTFIARNFKCLLCFGAGSLAIVGVLFFLLPHPAQSQMFIRSSSLVSFFNDRIAECERALSVYAVSYDALKRDEADAEVAALAQRRVVALMRKAEALRAAKQRIFVLPLEIGPDIADDDAVLYADSEEGVDIRMRAAYERIPARKDKRKRFLLAGWVFVNALFAVGLAGWSRRQKSGKVS